MVSLGLEVETQDKPAEGVVLLPGVVYSWVWSPADSAHVTVLALGKTGSTFQFLHGSCEVVQVLPHGWLDPDDTMATTADSRILR